MWVSKKASQIRGFGAKCPASALANAESLASTDFDPTDKQKLLPDVVSELDDSVHGLKPRNRPRDEGYEISEGETHDHHHRWATFG
jgi:hypothetical protein